MAPFGRVAVGVTPLLQLAARDPSAASSQISQGNVNGISARHESCLTPSGNSARDILVDCTLTKREAEHLGADIVVKKSIRRTGLFTNDWWDDDTDDELDFFTASDGTKHASIKRRSLKTKRRSTKIKPLKPSNNGDTTDTGSSDDESMKRAVKVRSTKKKSAKSTSKSAALKDRDNGDNTEGTDFVYSTDDDDDDYKRRVKKRCSKKVKRQALEWNDPYKLDSDYTSPDDCYPTDTDGDGCDE